MNDLTKILTGCSLALVVTHTLPGCGESSSSPSSQTHAADDGHDHAEGEHDEHDGHDHGEMRSLGTVTIAGTTLTISISSNIDPSSEVQLDLAVESGPIPAAVRFWVGDQAGTGALKSKADAHDDHFHGRTDTPAVLVGASLWIEIETADGERQSAAVPLE